ncbi:retrovirus-related pol polyprotein from transposon TNT 1-94 [Tanacetum coccineum]
MRRRASIHVPIWLLKSHCLKRLRKHSSLREMRWGATSVCMDDNPTSLKLWKHKFFLIDRRAIPDYMTWRHPKSCVSDEFPTDGFDQADVLRCLKRVDNHTIPPSSVGTPMPEPTPEEIVASQPECKVVKKAKETNKRKASTKPQEPSVTTKKKKLNRKYLENSLDKAEEDGSELTPRTGKKVDPPTRLPKGLLRRKAHRRHDHVDALAHSALGHDHDHANLSSSDDDAFFPTTGDEIMKKLFPLVPGPYYMPYPYVEGSSGEPPRVCLHYKDELSVIISTGGFGGDYTSSGPHAYINRLRYLAVLVLTFLGGGLVGAYVTKEAILRDQQRCGSCGELGQTTDKWTFNGLMTKLKPSILKDRKSVDQQPKEGDTLMGERLFVVILMNVKPELLTFYDMLMKKMTGTITRDLTDTTDSSGILNCHGGQICYQVDAHLLGNDTYFIAFIRFMGEDIEAKEFRYSLEMGVDRRELKWQGVPKSI